MRAEGGFERQRDRERLHICRICMYIYIEREVDVASEVRECVRERDALKALLRPPA